MATKKHTLQRRTRRNLGHGADGVLKTPDARYIIVNGRLWRGAKPGLDEADKERLMRELMSARRAVQVALKARDRVAERKARHRVHKAKIGLGERGPVWWGDGATDFTRRLVKNSPYAKWYASRSA